MVKGFYVFLFFNCRKSCFLETRCWLFGIFVLGARFVRSFGYFIGEFRFLFGGRFFCTINWEDWGFVYILESWFCSIFGGL